MDTGAFPTLPLCVLHHILSYLSTDERARVAMTCRRLRDASARASLKRRVWFSAGFGRRASETQLLALADDEGGTLPSRSMVFSPGVTHLDLTACGQITQRVVCSLLDSQGMTGLRSLRVAYCAGNDDLARFIGSLCPELRCFEVQPPPPGLWNFLAPSLTDFGLMELGYVLPVPAASLPSPQVCTGDHS